MFSDNLPTTEEQSKTQEAVLIIALLSGVLSALLVRVAWQADDAFAAWRLVDNFVNGYGPKYNLDERVQTFTSMLWTFLVAVIYFFTGNIYYTSIFTSIVLTLSAAALISWNARGNLLLLAYIYLTLCLSLSFMDFSAAGFENPLSHLLMACFTFLFLRYDYKCKRTYCALFFITALAALTRLDVLAIYFFPLMLVFLRSNFSLRTRLYGVLWLITPLVLWTSFSLIYYGFPLQNAAYAKRFNNLELIEYLKAGIDYYLNTLYRDPLTLSTILAGVLLGLTSRNVKLFCLALGVSAYLAYVFYIGGGYMGGRFFSLSFFTALIIIINVALVQRQNAVIAMIAITLLLGISAKDPIFTSGKDYGSKRDLAPTQEWHQRGITDERASWYQHSGLLLSTRFVDMPRPTPEWDFLKLIEKWVPDQTDANGRCSGMIIPTGYAGFFTPRHCHVFDSNGQVDPLMSRIPAPIKRDWKQGHQFKTVPAGYHATIRTGVNQITDPSLAAFYDKLSIITRGPIFSWKRFKTIVAMNLGYYDHYLEEYANRIYK